MAESPYIASDGSVVEVGMEVYDANGSASIVIELMIDSGSNKPYSYLKLPNGMITAQPVSMIRPITLAKPHLSEDTAAAPRTKKKTSSGE